MDPFQTNLVNNFNSFISNFQNKGYDFHIAVTATNAFVADTALTGYNSANAGLAKFRDGTDATSHTGVFVITPSTPNLSSVFVTNATQGANGGGDERAFSSFRVALNSPMNTGFLRTNSYLAVIILSDEDDFSSNTRANNSSPDHSYTYAGLDTVSSYVSYLDNLTASTGDSRRYNVSAIAVLDEACRSAHAAQSSSTIIGKRYMELAAATNGVTGSICDTSYASTLNLIQSHIAELSTQFYLDRLPDPSTIVVFVNGNSIGNSATNGWTYQTASNSVIFHGSAIPPQNASIQINFQPTTAK